MLQEAGAKLSAFHRSWVKVASKSDDAEAGEQFSEGSADEEVELEAASGLEPESRGFADLRLNHLATPPRALHYRRTPEVDQDPDRRQLAPGRVPSSPPLDRNSGVHRGCRPVDGAPRHFVR